MSDTKLREEWLEWAVNLLRPHFKKCNYELPDKVYVSCGFPATGGLRENKRVMGECWDNTCTSDGVHQIFINPLSNKDLEVLAILVHELGHTLFDHTVQHKKPFAKFFKEIGMEGKCTGITPGIELEEHLKSLAAVLGPYPHPKITPLEVERKTQTTRMLRITCPANEDHSIDILARMSKKTLELGTPNCFCGKEFLVEVTDEEEENV